MASRKLVRDLLLSKQFLYRPLLPTSQQIINPSTRRRLINDNRFRENNFVNNNVRQFSVFKGFSENVKSQATSDEQFQKSVKELKEKAEELKGVTEDFKVRSKQTTEKLYKQFDGAWTEAEAKAKKVSENLKETISAATEEVKGSFGSGKQESTDTSPKDGGDAKSGSESTSEDRKQQQPGGSGGANPYFEKLKSGFSSVSPKVAVVFQKLKDAKPVDFAKKGYDAVKDELSATPKRNKRLEYVPPPTSSSTGERSTRKDVTIVPTKQSRFSKIFEEVKTKIQGLPIYKRVIGISEPVLTKSQEIAEDIRDSWETSDSPVVHKIQDISDTVLGESSTAVSFKEIRARDPSFSLPEFIAEVQEIVRPVLVAYTKGDVEVLKKHCSGDVIKRCTFERDALQSQGYYLDSKILHISDVEVRETKIIGETPVIVVTFQTQQVLSVRDKLGAIKEGGEDTIHTVYYGWALKQMDMEEIDENALFPIWKVSEIQQWNVKALI